jgi:hypothetical protein
LKGLILMATYTSRAVRSWPNDRIELGSGKLAKKVHGEQNRGILKI